MAHFISVTTAEGWKEIINVDNIRRVYESNDPNVLFVYFMVGSIMRVQDNLNHFMTRIQYDK